MKINTNNEILLTTLAYKLGIKLNILQTQKLLKYLYILRKWNKIYNLCANADFNKMLAYHLLDSLSVAVHVNCINQNILDVGSGAGLPGIPLAILGIVKHITLLDSRAKRTVFLTHVINELELKNVNVELIRVEKYLPSTNFDLIVSRAFSDLRTFVSLTSRLLKKGKDSRIVAMKSDPKDFKLNTEVISGYAISQIKSFNVPNVIGPRSLMIVQKI